MKAPFKGEWIQGGDKPPVPEDLIFYTTKQVASLLEVHIETIKQAIYAGEIEAMKYAHGWRIPLPALKAYVASIWEMSDAGKPNEGDQG